MDFNKLNKPELEELADFFAVEAKAADADKGPTKKELVAALVEDEVSEEDYETFKSAKATGQDKSPEVRAQEAAEAAEAAEADAEAAEEEVASDDSKEEEPAAVDESDYVLIKYERKNPTYEIMGYRFTRTHPFLRVPEEVAEKLVGRPGFRPAMPKEVADYYN